MDRLRILAISQLLPKVDESSGDRRFLAILQMLATEHAVDLWVEGDERNWPWRLRPLEIERHRAHLESFGVSVLDCGASPLIAALSNNRYDAGWFEFYFIANRYVRLFRCLQASARVIIDSVDLHFIRLAGAASISAGPKWVVNWTKRRELAAYRGADAIVAASMTDAKVVDEQHAMPPRFVIPNIVPLRTRTQHVATNEILFVGHFRHDPNVDGILWFVREIWPDVHRAVPSARLLIIGSHAPARVRTLDRVPGVRFIGHVPDTAPYLDRARVSIAPLRYGAGMKGKINEAMASGLPVVTTSVGVEGIHVVHGEHVLISDTTEDFARAVVSLLKQPEFSERIGKAAQQRVAVLYTAEAIQPGLSNMLRSVLDQPPLRHAESWKYQIILSCCAARFLRTHMLGPIVGLYWILCAFVERFRNPDLIKEL